MLSKGHGHHGFVVGIGKNDKSSDIVIEKKKHLNENSETAASKYLKQNGKAQTRRFQPTRRGDGYETFLSSASIACAK
jgi:hypothetical protein